MSASLPLHGAGYCAMATYPGRFASLRRCLLSVAPQLDRLFVYVNETTEGMPDLSDLPNVTVLDGREHRGNLSANGKIYPLRYMEDCTVFLLDDDIVYPADYVASYRRHLARLDGRGLLTTHGTIFPPQIDWYYERCRVFWFADEVAHLNICTLAGSGTSAFEQRRLRVPPDDFLGEVMVDLRLSLLAREQDLPIWVMPRPARWLEPIQGPGLWNIMKASHLTCHTREARTIDWSFGIYRGITRAALAEIGIEASALGLDPELQRGLDTGIAPSAWRLGATAFAQRKEYLEVLANAHT